MQKYFTLVLGYLHLLHSSKALFFGCCPPAMSNFLCMPCNSAVYSRPVLPPPPPPPAACAPISPPIPPSPYQISPPLGPSQQQLSYGAQENYGSQLMQQLPNQPYGPSLAAQQQPVAVVERQAVAATTPVVPQQTTSLRSLTEIPQRQQQTLKPRRIIRPMGKGTEFVKKVGGMNSKGHMPVKRTSFQNETVISDKDVNDALNAIDDIGNETLIIHQPSKPVPISSLAIINDNQCNNNNLRAILLENIGENLNMAKRLIQLAAEAQFGGQFDVICSKNDFSYLTNTELFCQENKGGVSCYAYRQL